ncbi:hypothetical protein PRZ48_003176 [Zasmidium cellare]|uniref:Uncharacterized protein n=1 Tax=Zasmidium cellare TaxID=395010 RepID=A0ABR0EVW1_ZASCE|nr:hypothetical protein PRZ48_003176 [Zasmidium cellare]
MAMPPPPFAQQGQGFDPIPQFNTGGYDSDDFGGFGDEPRRNNSTKKNKDDKKKKNAPVEVQYEGFMLEKAAPNQVGEKPNWSRVGRRPLAFSDAKLATVCKKVRIEDGMGPLNAFLRLTGDQQGVINLLIAKRQQEEKSKDAEWVLECVKKYIKRNYRTRTKEVIEIMVILKRQDRNATTSSQRVTATATGGNLFQQSEIIDLAEPLKEKKKDKEKKKKDRDEDDLWGEPMMGGGLPDPFARDGHGHDQHHDGPIIDVPPGPPHGHPQQQQNHQGPMPGHGQQFPPQGAIPVGAWPPPPGQHPQHQGPMPHDGNPFQPNAPFNIPGAFEMPPGFDGQRPNHFQTRAQTPMGRHDSRSRSRSREERELRRRLSQDQERRDSQHRLERKLDDIQDRLDRDDRLNDVMNRVADWNLRENTPPSSADSYREGDDWWSAQGSFTPPSSPPLSAVMEGPSGTLGRKGYHARKDSGYGYPREYHRRSAGNVVVEPSSTE